MYKAVTIMFFGLLVVSCSTNGETAQIIQTAAWRLQEASSPYLREHADNLIAWHQWGDAAFEKAARENKLIYLSIGYLSCHWCHVMEEESFIDSEVAGLLNEHFVSILVDREERPDIDANYLTVSQLLTGRGGWPLNVFLTPGGKPIYTATYIPKSGRSDRSGMLDLLPRIQQIWQESPEELQRSGEEIQQALENYVGSDLSGESLSVSDLTAAFEQLVNDYDPINGGFGVAPKFPQAHNYVFLLRYWQRTGNSEALAMAEQSLFAMRAGGLYDQVGNGFHRYSTDREWRVPHFEKMLYDQATLSLAYVEAFHATGKSEFGATAKSIYEYVIHDLGAAGGAFFSAEDADSEGEEGTFYLWTADELRRAAGDSFDFFAELFDIADEGNYRDEATGQKTGKNILAASGLSMATLGDPRWIALQKALLEDRNGRIRPLRDEKILTDWNGLMIAALAKGGALFNNSRFVGAAEKAAEYILKNAYSDNLLKHTAGAEGVGVEGFLSDYAYFVYGLIELYQATFKDRYLSIAVDLTTQMISLFADADGGGFYASSANKNSRLVRSKPVMDASLPSGNSIAAMNLARLSRLSGNLEFEERAVDIGSAFGAVLKRLQGYHTSMMLALSFVAGPTHEVVVVEGADPAGTAAVLTALRTIYEPNMVILLKNQKNANRLRKLAPFTRFYDSIENKTTVYVCQNFACELPTTDIQEMLELLRRPSLDVDSPLGE